MTFSLILLIAAVQGVTEFLPISSSGHLALIPAIIRQPYQGQAIDVAAHVGTLIAVLFYLRRDLLNIIASMFGSRNAIHMTNYQRLGMMIVGIWQLAQSPIWGLKTPVCSHGWESKRLYVAPIRDPNTCI